MVHEVIIIGSGPAGYTAAIYAARAELKPLMFAGLQPGGQLMLTSEVENWPGEADGVMGPDLMEKLKKQALRFNTDIRQEEIAKVDFSKRPFTVTTSAGVEHQAKSVIISTGASAKWLNVPGEKELQGKGVSACATCDGFFFRGKEVVVVGGGDSAMEEATFLTRFATKVTLIHRSEAFRASRIMLERAQKNPKISFVMNTVIDHILGEEKVTGVRLKNVVTGELSEMTADGVFAAIGHAPNTGIFKDFLKLDEKQYIVTEPGSTKTNVEGVFAAGDVADHYYRQAITAAGTGCMAALDAERWLAAQE
ncbi:MAG: thioredoxin reductase [Patescibacteria group bacterium]|jgi:thioredoxin reductase (NADPH)|nr:thioredoxin reductase [Patescibacteria group bacterium]